MKEDPKIDTKVTSQFIEQSPIFVVTLNPIERQVHGNVSVMINRVCWLVKVKSYKDLKR